MDASSTRVVDAARACDSSATGASYQSHLSSARVPLPASQGGATEGVTCGCNLPCLFDTDGSSATTTLLSHITLCSTAPAARIRRVLPWVVHETKLLHR